MICRDCGALVADGLLACLKCLHERSSRALRDFQRDPLRRVLAGSAELTTRAQRGVRHVQMFGAEQTFCGLPVHSQDRKNRFSWKFESLERLCSSCRAEVEKQIEELT